MKPLSVTIIYNKDNTYGLQDDVTVLERLLKKIQENVGQTINKPKIVDIREPFSHSDIVIHLEIPVFSAIAFGHTNMILVNPEQWSYNYDAYAHAFDVLLFRDCVSAQSFRDAFEKKGLSTDNIYVVPWCSYLPRLDNIKSVNEFVCLIGGSKNKYDYMMKLLPFWCKDDPPLTIYTSRNDFAENVKKHTFGKVICKDLDKTSQHTIMSSYNGHVICSSGEGFGYAAANAEMVGAFAIMNKLPVFEYTYAIESKGIESKGIAWLTNTYQVSDKVRYEMAQPSENVRSELEAAFISFSQYNTHERKERASMRFLELYDAFLPVFDKLKKEVEERRPSKGVFHCPPILSVENCPPISIITPTYNRKKMFDIAFHNMLATDYPHTMIEWVIIEDNEEKERMASKKILEFQLQVPIKMKYIPIEGRMSIGEKRNIAIDNATNDIILFMDDDDHYTPTSFRRRVAWLTKGVKRQKIVCCTTLPLYDLQRGTSAINVPPYDIAFSQRISEATLTFYKSAWVERAFPLVSIAEGESWIHGREDQVLEISPQQIIVAFTHGTNQSSRKVPDTKPSCFWGFPKEYLVFIHKLVGVEVEETKKTF